MEDSSHTQENFEFKHFAPLLPPEILNHEECAKIFDADCESSARELETVLAELEAVQSKRKLQLTRAKEDMCRKRDIMREELEMLKLSVESLKQSTVELTSMCQVKEQLKVDETEDENLVSEEDIKNLLNVVVLKEQKKKKKVKYLIEMRSSILYRMKLYKRWLDCFVEYNPPDEFIFSFEGKKKWTNAGSAVWARLKASEDMKQWQLLEMSESSPIFSQMAEDLEKTGDIRRFIVDARRYYFNKKQILRAGDS